MAARLSWPVLVALPELDETCTALEEGADPLLDDRAKLDGTWLVDEPTLLEAAIAALLLEEV